MTSSREASWTKTMCYTSLSLPSSSVRADTPISSLQGGTGTVDLGAEGALMQQVSLYCCVGLEVAIVMGFLRVSVDSISTCSKKMYLIARRRAKVRQITCSMSMVIILYDKTNRTFGFIRCRLTAI